MTTLAVWRCFDYTGECITCLPDHRFHNKRGFPMTLPTSSSLAPHLSDALQAPPPQPKVVVIGAGRWGRNLIRNLYQLGGLYGVCDAQAASIATTQGVLNNWVSPSAEVTPETVQWFTTLDAVIADPAVDAVMIATPSHTHAALAMKALRAGKHVYVEKPMATTTADAHAVHQLATAQEKLLMVGHLLIYHPAVNRLRDFVRDGELGEIAYIHSDRLNYNAFRSDESVLWDLAPHDLSLMGWVLGEMPESVVQAYGQRTAPDGKVDVGMMSVRFSSGLVGHLACSWVHPQKQVRLLVRGHKRTAVLDDTLAEGKLQVFNTESGELVREEPLDYLPLEPLALECQHFLNCIRYGTVPQSHAEQGVITVSLLEMAHRML